MYYCATFVYFEAACALGKAIENAIVLGKTTMKNVSVGITHELGDSCAEPQKNQELSWKNVY